MAYISVKKLKELINQINVKHDIHIRYATPHSSETGAVEFIKCPYCKRILYHVKQLSGEYSAIPNEKGRLATCPECGGELVIG